MLHEALMLEIYRQALNAGALPTARPRSTESANSSERCPSHDSNSSENGRDQHGGGVGSSAAASMLGAAAHSLMQSPNATFPAMPQNVPAQPPSMEAYLHMVAAAAQQYGFPLGAAAAAASSGPRLPLPLPTEASAPFKLPPHHGGSPTASSNNSEALDFRTNLFGRAASAEPLPSEEDDDEYDGNDGNNPLDLSVGPRKRSADVDNEPDSTIGQIQVKKIFKSAESPPAQVPAQQQHQQQHHQQQQQQQQHTNSSPLMSSVNPYLAAVAAANIFRSGQFPDWNGKSDLVVDPLEKMSDIVKGPRKEKNNSGGAAGQTARANAQQQQQQHQQQQQQQQQAASGGQAQTTPVQVPTSSANSGSSALPPATEGMSKARHNIWQSHWQNKGVASSVFRCVWCKQSFSTLEALTTHMKDSKHCGVNVPPFGNLPTANERHHHHHHHTASSAGGGQGGGGGGSGGGGGPGSGQQHPHHNLRKAGQSNHTPSAAAKNAFQYRGDPPTPLPRKLVRGQNVWLGKGVEQAMQILKCMRCGESFRSLGDMTKHMQETQHYTNILSQDQTMSVKSSNSSGGGNSGHAGDGKDGQNSLSSEESRTLSAVLTCKVCDKAFNSLGDLSNHMAKNNHYSEPLMQSMAGGQGNRKRPAPKKREKSLPVRKLLEMKGAQTEADLVVEKMQLRNYTENAKRMSMEGGGGGGNAGVAGSGIGPGSDKSEAALFAERMRQYISGVKNAEETAKANLSAASLLAKTKSSPDLEQKNGATKTAAGQAGQAGGSSSVLSAIEQMFTTSFDTPPRHASLPATSPSNSSTKNTSPVASSILKRLGIDETVDYNKPLMDTSDPYYQHYRYTSSERSASECSAETHVENLHAARVKMEAPPTPNSEKLTTAAGAEDAKREPKSDKCGEAVTDSDTDGGMQQRQQQQIKMEIKSELMDDVDGVDERDEDAAMKSPMAKEATTASNNNNNNGDKTTSALDNERCPSRDTADGQHLNNNNNSSSNNNNNNTTKERSLTPPQKLGSPLGRAAARSPTDSHRSATPKSPASSIKSYDGDKKYPSDSLNALSSMFDSLGSSSASGGGGRHQQQHHQQQQQQQQQVNKIESPENLSTTSNSLAALRQFCVKKEKTA